MKNVWIRMTAAAALVLAAGTVMAAPPGKPRFVPFGETWLTPQDMNGDGSVIVGRGYFGLPTFRYTAGGGIEILGGGCSSGTASVSEDGNTVLSCITRDDGIESAAAWTGGEWRDLGSVPGAVNCDANLSSGWDLSGDGRTAVGLVWLAQICRAHGGSWDLVNGGPANDLGSTFEGRASRANAVNYDGRIIAGWQDDDFGRTGAIWVDGVESPVLTDAGESVGEVQFVNGDGSVMVGNNLPYGTPNSWIWTAKRGFTAISAPSTLYQPFAIDAADDGSVVVGVARDRNGNPKGFFWTSNGTKFTWMDDYLAKKGLAPDWKIGAVSAISGDGRTLAGYGINPNGEVEGFVLENF